MNIYKTEVKKFGNYAELKRTIIREDGRVELPVQNFSSKTAAMEAGREWVMASKEEAALFKAAYGR